MASNSTAVPSFASISDIDLQRSGAMSPAMGRTTPTVQPAPDGGWGFVVAIAAHIIYILVIGMFRCSGVLFLSWMNEFDASALQTGAIGSVIASCSFFGSPLAAVACDRYGCRFTGILSGVVTAIGLFGSSWVRDVYQMYVMCAVAGLGIAFAIMAANVVIVEYFKKYFMIVNGFTSSGVGVGMIVQPLMLRLLLDRYGWRGAILILSGLSANICVAGALFRPLRSQRMRVGLPRTRQQIDLQSAASVLQNRNMVQTSTQSSCGIDQQHPRASGRKSPRVCLSRMASSLGFNLFHKNYRFTLFCLIQVQLNISYMTYIVFIVPRAQSIDVGGTSAAYLVSIIGFGSLVGRLASGFLINRKLTAEVVFACSTFVCFVGVLIAQFGSYGAFVASSGLIGLGTGVVKSAHNVLVRDFVGVVNFGRGLGIADIFRGIGDLAGPIVAGQLYDTMGDYVIMFYVIAALFFVIVIQMATLMPILRRLEPVSTTEHNICEETDPDGV